MSTAVNLFKKLIHGELSEAEQVELRMYVNQYERSEETKPLTEEQKERREMIWKRIEEKMNQ